MPGRGSGSSDTSSSSVPEQQEARYRGLEWRTASKKGERDMRERGVDHRTRSLAVPPGGATLAVGSEGARAYAKKKTDRIAPSAGPGGGSIVAAPPAGRAVGAAAG